MTPAAAKSLRHWASSEARRAARADAIATRRHWIESGVAATDIARALNCHPNWRDIEARIELILLAENTPLRDAALRPVA
jgi:hypothetical protein